MSRYPALRTLFVGACLLVATAAAAQTQTKPFEPTVGQAGKDVVWVPTPEALVDKMLDLAKLTPQDFLMDLGSGDGRTVITAGKRGARALGIEFNPDMVELSRRNATAAGVTDRANRLSLVRSAICLSAIFDYLHAARGSQRHNVVHAVNAASKHIETHGTHAKHSELRNLGVGKVVRNLSYANPAGTEPRQDIH